MFGLFRSGKIEDVAPNLPLRELKKRVKIVVIDDDENSFPTTALQNDGYTIDWWNRVDAPQLQRLENGDYDIVILDIQGIADSGLSDTGDGLGILKRVKSVNPNQIVVAFSGKSYELDSVPFWKLADDALRKPVTMIGCKEVLDRLIQDRVSVPAYWASVRGILQLHGVPEKKIAALESAVVGKVKKGKPMTLDEVKALVGGIEVVATVFGIIQKVLILCKTLI